MLSAWSWNSRVLANCTRSLAVFSAPAVRLALRSLAALVMLSCMHYCGGT
jgi:hypothetical protein